MLDFLLSNFNFNFKLLLLFIYLFHYIFNLKKIYILLCILGFGPVALPIMASLQVYTSVKVLLTSEGRSSGMLAEEPQLWAQPSAD